MADYVGAIDQGTTSTRFMIFDRGGNVIGVDQKEHEQIYPKAGMGRARPDGDLGPHDRRDQRRPRQGEHHGAPTSPPWASRTSARPRVVWDRHTGQAGLQRPRLAGHAASRTSSTWSPTADQDRLREKTGLPLATYFSGTKIRWILDNVEGVRARAEAGDLLFGNIDTWVIWNLTGGIDGGVHVTDVSNASRTLLMNLATLDWDDELLSIVGVPRSMLPDDQGLVRGLRHGEGRTARRHPGRG